jgi:hypothetical protein
VTDKNPILNWTTIISAVLGLLGGAVSGGIAAYVQLKTTQEQFSIERARMFKELITELRNEKTARMALLNLWQLYPDERDQKIIVAAAIESGQPDLVETIIGFEDELKQLAEILQAKAALGEGTALPTLMRIDPVRASEVMIGSISSDIRLKGDRYVANDTIRNLKRLAETNKEVVAKVQSKAKEFPEVPLLLDYMLYDAGADSQFVERITAAYNERRQLELFNEFLGQANFKHEDAAKITASARRFVMEALNDSKSNQYDLIGAMVGLRNNTLQEQLDTRKSENLKFAEALHTAVGDPQKTDRVRQKALLLLRKISRRQTLGAMAQALCANSVGPHLKREIERMLDGGLIESLKADKIDFIGPKDCKGFLDKDSIDNVEAWKKWLEEQVI